MIAEPDFATRLLAWFDIAGRHDLPWQHPRSPYRVWLSEVMLQQTQVATVVPYFERFVQAMPDVAALARAPSDDVLALWSGLGYYSRARNLHRAAQLCVARHEGQLPATPGELSALPGIGRSTAGAILALAFGQRAAILDGNVRRVLVRHRGIAGDPLSSANQSTLWSLSESLLPGARIDDYTQAIMDLGATVCTRAKPRCGECPVRGDCIAFREGRTTELPNPRRRMERGRRSCHALVVRDAVGRVLLERRAPTGVWGGLWSLPEFPDQAALQGHALFAGTRPAASEQCDPPRDLPAIHHAFTHFDLTLHPVLVTLGEVACAVSETDSRRWFDARDLRAIGLPAPIRRLLHQIPERTNDT